MVNFRVLQLSDFHFCVQPRRKSLFQLAKRKPAETIDAIQSHLDGTGTLTWMKPESYVPTIVNGVARFAWKNANRLDCCLITGDLATTGLLADLQEAQSYVTDAATDRYYTAKNAHSLQGMNKSIYVVPGNHDTYKDDDGHPAGSAHFRLKFTNHLKNYRDNVGHVIREKEGVKLAFVFADFSLRNSSDTSGVLGVKRYPANLLRYGQGRVYNDTLSELNSRISVLRASHRNIPIIAVVHFAPYECGSDLYLNEYGAFISLMNELRVRAILCGHTHRHSVSTAGKSVVYCAGSSGSADCENNSFVHVYDIDVDRGEYSIGRKNYVWSWEQHDFLLGRDDLIN